MARNPSTRIEFETGRGRRVVEDLPGALPDVGNDFDWAVRDFDSFRTFMLQELAARVPERSRWTPADVEVVLVEVLAAALDQLSDMLDRVAAEAYLETARRPESVRRLLQFIGFDAVRSAFARHEIAIDPGASAGAAAQELEELWAQNPVLMEAARRAGPKVLFKPQRAVRPEDYAAMFRAHPLVRQAAARSEWAGSWMAIRIVVLSWDERPLDEKKGGIPEFLKQQVEALHRSLPIELPRWKDGAPVLMRDILNSYAEAFRMLGHELILEDARLVGIDLTLDVEIEPEYFQSEVLADVEAALGSGPEGLFAPGKLELGEDLYASAITEALMRIDGVKNVAVALRCSDWSQGGQASTDLVRLGPREVATCRNDPERPKLGRYQLLLRGGRPG